jgi:transcriptional regulator with XRE-family HTH domain
VDTTNALIDKAVAQVLARSDNAFAIKMGWSASTLTNYRKGRSRLSDDHLVAICKLLGEPPAKYAVELAIERATTEKARKLWESVRAKLATVTALALLTVVVPNADAHAVRMNRADATASTNAFTTVQSVHYAQLRRFCDENHSAVCGPSTSCR